MRLAPSDWLLVVGYFVGTILVGLYYKSRSRGLDDYFVSGRSLPWWLAGTSLVATTFASDTPLAVTALVAKNGLAGNWFWWSMAMGHMIMVFVYSRLWRRAEVLTDNELIELRYGGKPARFLRGFRAVYFVLILQAVTNGWVTVAMLNVLKQTIFAGGAVADGGHDGLFIALLLAVTGFYSILSGLWGVVITDFVQFGLAMLGCIILAVLAVNQVGGMAELQAAITAGVAQGAQAFNYLPDFSAEQPWLRLDVFLIMIFVQWWASSYMSPSGNGYFVQRMAACKNERESLLSCLWFTVAHYCLRPWPWIMVAFAALVLIPGLRELPDPGVGYPMLIARLAPAGVFGLMLVTFIAAFMSTISTHVNLGASYLVHDVYRRFFRPRASDQELLRASRLATALVLLWGGIVTFLMREVSIDAAWRILAAVGAGTGIVQMLRWFWWRINAWSEISAMVAALITFVLLPDSIQIGEYRMLVIAGVTSLVWLAVTFLTPAEDPERLERFYRKVRPGGPGWSAIAARAPEVVTDSNLGMSILAAFVASGVVFLTLPAIGEVIFGRYSSALLFGMLAVLCGFGVVLIMKATRWELLSR